MKIQKHLSLQPYNTFGINVKADYFAEVHNIDELKEIRSSPELRPYNLLILGGGSNVLFTKHFNGLVLLNLMKGISVLKEEEGFAYIKAGSGEVWHEFVIWCINKGYGGLENLSLIPGSVGAGPMQNIGAYGVELKDSFYELNAMDLDTLEERTFSVSDCRFGYRESVFKHELKNQYFITSVTFKLSINPVLNTSYGAIQQELGRMGVGHPGIKDVSQAVINIRRSKLPDPKELGNAGSFFKNPEVEEAVFSNLKLDYPNIIAYPTSGGRVKLAAGWLIEQCGWKGKVVGNTGSHKDQALVLVNYGNAQGKEIYELALAIRDSVIEKFGIRIDPEVNVY